MIPALYGKNKLLLNINVLQQFFYFFVPAFAKFTIMCYILYK